MLTEVLETSRALVEDTTYRRALDWKKAGGKVVGCFPVYTPVELIHAGGMLPLGVVGGGTSVELAHADSRFQSFVCSIAKSTLELGFQGRLGLLDGILFSSICDVARNLSSVFKRNFPDLHVDYLHYPQNMSSAGVIDYMEGELRRVRDNLQRACGVEIRDDRLSASILVWNRWRALIADLYALRRDEPQKISTVELYLLFRAGTLMPVEEHIPLLESSLAEFRTRTAKPRDCIRVVVEAAFCEQPPIGLIEVLEEAGCYIVDDDLLRGWRFFDTPVAEDGPPLRSLAAAYVDGSTYSSVRHDWRKKRWEGLIDRVRLSRADAVIFMPAKFCEPALFDYVLYREALEKASIPHLMVEFEEKMWTFERTRNEVETFVESMLFD